MVLVYDSKILLLGSSLDKLDTVEWEKVEESDVIKEIMYADVDDDVCEVLKQMYNLYLDWE